MNKPTCITCQKPNATLKCELCHADTCKACVQRMPEGAFSFLEKIPSDFTHQIYCAGCFDTKVAPELDAYNQTMDLAKDVNVFFKAQSKETRTFKRKEKPVRTAECGDYDEALMRLAFLAAKLGFNSLIDVQMESKKQIVNNYQSTIWWATGIPTQLTAGQLHVKNNNNPN